MAFEFIILSYSLQLHQHHPSPNSMYTPLRKYGTLFCARLYIIITIITPTPAPLMDIPSVKTGQQLYITIIIITIIVWSSTLIFVGWSPPRGRSP